MKLQNNNLRSFALLTLVIIYFSFSGYRTPGNVSLIEKYLYSAAYNNFPPDDLPNWESKDPAKDGYEGVRTNEFYQFLKTLPSAPERSEVIVAVIDDGFDTEHPDLKENIWNNEKEVNGEAGIDDDENGYVDDFHGWNFLGDRTETTLEVTREYYRLKKMNVSETDVYFLKVKEKFDEKIEETIQIKKGVSETLNEYEKAEEILREKNITTDPQKLMGLSKGLEGKYQDAASIILGIYMLFGTDKTELAELDKEYETKLKVLFDSLDYEINTEADLLEKNYGNNNVLELTDGHGTHVSGIIASKKNGQAPFAKIMCLFAVPTEGDERDKDVGNAIRYAADNGASIINMSAGKYFSPNPEFVIDAIKYAEEKGVLFVVSAGNEGVDMSNIDNFPKKFYMENGEKKFFSNVIVVGASTWMKQWSKEKDPMNKNVKYDLAAPFSNYSADVVDIFAPGAEIYSTFPNDKYKMESGTSMAAPVVAGIAAVLKAYFPQLTAAQLKEIIVSSARQYDGLKVKLKDKSSKELFSKLSKSGGVIDLMNAYKKASEMSTLQN
ncbi:MAG TPA: S8 family serine peptidase [Ignavibacteria bacterium]|nr:S8 family serine peptidase [Ignavibacteria bacterium]